METIQLVFALIMLFIIAWTILISLALVGMAIVIYRQHQFMVNKHIWDKSVWFFLGFASNIFFPLLKPFGNSSENRRAAPSTSTSTSGNNRNSSGERVTTYTTTLDPSEFGSIFDLLSNSMNPEPREQTSDRRSRRSRNTTTTANASTDNT